MFHVEHKNALNLFIKRLRHLKSLFSFLIKLFWIIGAWHMTCTHVTFSYIFCIILYCSILIFVHVNFTLKHLLPKREKYMFRICTILRVVIAVCTHMIRLGTKLKLPLFRYKTSVYGVLILKSPVYVHTKDVFMWQRNYYYLLIKTWRHNNRS